MFTATSGFDGHESCDVGNEVVAWLFTKQHRWCHFFCLRVSDSLV